MSPTRAQPAISVVVSTYGRATLLPRLVAALEAQQVPGGLEAVIVDDGSKDGTWATLERLARENVLDLLPLRLERNRGPSAGRNAGWRAARAPLVAFTDDDCVPQPGWAAALLARLDEADVVEGLTVPDPAQRATLGPFSHTVWVKGSKSLFQTCNIAYRRRLLERLGGFDESFRRSGEDADLGWRARESGAVTAFEPEAVVWHDVRPSSFIGHLRFTLRWDGVVLAVRRHPALREQFHRRWFWRKSHPPALLSLAGMVLALNSRMSPRLRIGALVLVLPYVHFRIRVWPLKGGPRRRLAAIPLALVADLEEVGVFVAASLRHRTLLL